ncbi:glycoside hydrolase superfamily [Aspergillus karnatakaensis]|uniref:beta-glucosidase H n=1 Tax=Aspergillus karnatakaensis TaxID=1810916 RepID=UPI003CCE3D46
MSEARGLDDIDLLVSRLSLREKVKLLSGQGSFRTTALLDYGIPSIVTSDGPHGLRGARKFNRVPICLLPSATAMGATFDVELMRRVGNILVEEARSKNVHVLLAPTVCLLRSPLMGRGFEAFSEDPVLSGLIASAYINGIQERGVAACIKHYAAHDQSLNSIEDNVCMTERTLRELHLLTFQIAYRLSRPLSFMTSYNRINGVHSSEDPLLLQKILRTEWGFDGLVMSDWWDTYSTSEALNAGLDLEIPGPTQFRGKLLRDCTQHAQVEPQHDPSAANTPENRAIIRKVVADSIVLLKNEKQVLPLSVEKKKAYGLIGSHFKYPTLSGGGSAEGDPYYSVTPYEGMIEAVGVDNVIYTPGSYTFKFSPPLKHLTQPGTNERGWFIEILRENPQLNPDTKPVYSTYTDKDLIDIPESLHHLFPKKYFVSAKAVFKAEAAARFRFGFSVAGKGKVYIDGADAIDLWSTQPPNTHDTPCFNRLSMERFFDINVIAGQELPIHVLMVNEDVTGGVGTAFTLTGRLGGYEVLDSELALLEAARVASTVDIPIVMTGLTTHHESENSDRKHLRLPPGADLLIETVLAANPDAIIVTQSGCPIEMPWVSKADTLLHAWYGGQETGHGLVDVLFGHVNPAANLPMTFPQSVKHNPAYLAFGKSDYNITYDEGVFIGHRYYEAVERHPLFYFGHGLSYTTFEYSNLTVPDMFYPDATLEISISVDITNTGSRGGAEVVQIYICDPESSVLRPARELKAFSKVYMKSGETKAVTMALDKYALSFWSERDSQWKAEAGEFVVVVATSADPKAEVARRSFTLPKTFYWSGL